MRSLIKNNFKLDAEENKIYIMLTRTGTLVSNLIHMYTKAPYSHVSLSFDINLNEVYSFGRYNPYNPVHAGFIEEEIDEFGIYGRFPNTDCAIYSLDLDYEEYIKLRANILNFKLDAEKYRYNLIGLMGVMVNVPINREYNYFCSQFVSKVLVDSDVDLFNKNIGLVSPEDFRQCRRLKLIYEGKLKDIYSLDSKDRREYINNNYNKMHTQVNLV